MRLQRARCVSISRRSRASSAAPFASQLGGAGGRQGDTGDLGTSMEGPIFQESMFKTFVGSSGNGKLNCGLTSVREQEERDEAACSGSVSRS